MVPFKRQRKYLQSDKGKIALRRYREKPDVKKRQKIYQELYKGTKREKAKIRYYYSTDPLPSIRKLFIES